MKCFTCHYNKNKSDGLASYQTRVLKKEESPSAQIENNICLQWIKCLIVVNLAKLNIFATNKQNNKQYCMCIL